MVKPPIVIHIFHRDLRINDNEGFALASAKASKNKTDLVALFIFTPEQVTDKNRFRSLNSVEFMLNSLEDLNNQLKNPMAWARWP